MADEESGRGVGDNSSVSKGGSGKSVVRCEIVFAGGVTTDSSKLPKDDNYYNVHGSPTGQRYG